MRLRKLRDFLTKYTPGQMGRVCTPSRDIIFPKRGKRMKQRCHS
jgi:hypothetical protein